MSGSEATLKAITRMENSGEITSVEMVEGLYELFKSFKRIEFLDMLDRNI